MTQLNLFGDRSLASVTWTGERAAAVDRLKTFLPRAGRDYAARRNYDLGRADRSNVSCLSPWIRHRLLLEEDVLRATLDRHAPSSADKFVQEVFWRAYFKGWLQHRPSVWFSYRAEIDRLIETLERSPEMNALYKTAVQGTTGIDCFDAWAKELVETGYLHNHTRMWFASIWIFTLRLPWQLGADFFYRNLLDGDPASNTLSWRWVGGLHTKGKTYLARKSNIEKYTEGRFSPIGLAGSAPALVEDEHHALQPKPSGMPLVSAKPFALILTEEDCNAESLPLPGKPKGICSLGATAARSSLEVGAQAQKFTAEAMADGLDRARDHFQCDGQQIETKDWGPFLVDWAQELGVDTILTAQAPIGPTREHIDGARTALKSAGITLAEIGRPYDEACWTYATKGFFGLKAKIPHLVEKLDLG
ncbi:MAG: FAD-binding domain-containing protein [Pseudomonadota bacterium]